MKYDIDELRKPLSGAFYVSDHRLCISRAGEIVDETDISAVSLLVGAGGLLDGDIARAYGLVVESEAVQSDESPSARRAASIGGNAPEPDDETPDDESPDDDDEASPVDDDDDDDSDDDDDESKEPASTGSDERTARRVVESESRRQQRRSRN